MKRRGKGLTPYSFMTNFVTDCLNASKSAHIGSCKTSISQGGVEVDEFEGRRRPSWIIGGGYLPCSQWGACGAFDSKGYAGPHLCRGGDVELQAESVCS